MKHTADMVSQRTLRMLDKAAKNFKQGNVSEPIDLDISLSDMPPLK